MTDTGTDSAGLESVQRLSKDLKEAARTLSPHEARFLVDTYYLMQEDRKRSANQVLALDTSEEPNSVLAWFTAQNAQLEKQVQSALTSFSQGHPVGRWAESITGIGPIISAGLLAHIDITEAPTVGHIWRFAGLDPTAQWLSGGQVSALLHEIEDVIAGMPAAPDAERADDAPDPALVLAATLLATRIGRQPRNLLEQAQTDRDGEAVPLTEASLVAAASRRPWNAGLKTLAWKVGQSFMKVQGSADDFYGSLYAQRKIYEIERNERGELADQAAAKLQKFKIGRTTDAYRWYAGRITPGAALAYRQALHAEAERLRLEKAAGNKDVKPKAPRLQLVQEGEGIPMLPPAHIDARARRWVVKLFLSHWHTAAYFQHYGVLPPKPYVLEHIAGHVHRVVMPHMEMLPGLAEAWRAYEAAAH